MCLVPEQAQIRLLDSHDLRFGCCKTIQSLTNNQALGEQVVREIFPEATILRPCVLFGRQDLFLNKYAFIQQRWPISARVCKDQRIQPLWVRFCNSIYM